MSMNDPLAGMMSAVLNSEKIGRRECTVQPSSKLMKEILKLMQDHKYIGAFEEIENGKGNLLKIQLIGKINKCGVIKPRYAVQIDTLEKFERRYLPAKGFGILILSTMKGLMTHEKADELGIGGRLIAYVY